MVSCLKCVCHEEMPEYGCFLEATLCDNGEDITLYKNICLTLSISKVFV